MVFHRFGKATLNKTRDSFGVRLDQLGHVGVVGGFGDLNTRLSIFVNHLDFVGVFEQFCEPRVWHDQQLFSRLDLSTETVRRTTVGKPQLANQG